MSHLHLLPQRVAVAEAELGADLEQEEVDREVKWGARAMALSGCGGAGCRAPWKCGDGARAKLFGGVAAGGAAGEPVFKDGGEPEGMDDLREDAQGGFSSEAQYAEADLEVDAGFPGGRLKREGVGAFPAVIDEFTDEAERAGGKGRTRPRLPGPGEDRGVGRARRRATLRARVRVRAYVRRNVKKKGLEQNPTEPIRESSSQTRWRSDSPCLLGGGQHAWHGRCRTIFARGIAAVEAGLSRRAAAERFGIGVATAIRWVRAFRASGSIQARPKGGDLRSHRIEAYRDVILGAVAAQVDMTLVELAEMLRRDHGLHVAPSTVWRFLDRHAMTIKKNRARLRAGQARRARAATSLVRRAA